MGKFIKTSYILSEEDNWGNFAVIVKEPDSKDLMPSIIKAIEGEASAEVCDYSFGQVRQVMSLDWGESKTLDIQLQDGEEFWSVKVTVQKTISYL